MTCLQNDYHPHTTPQPLLTNSCSRHSLLGLTLHQLFQKQQSWSWPPLPLPPPLNPFSGSACQLRHIRNVHHRSHLMESNLFVTKRKRLLSEESDPPSEWIVRKFDCWLVYRVFVPIRLIWSQPGHGDIREQETGSAKSLSTIRNS